jgi:DNA-binding response OmpR family regulator
MKGVKVLVIEDDPSVSAVVRDLLVAEEYNVQVAGDLASGLAQAVQFRPQLIILDLNLPDGDGLKLCASLKESTSTRDIEIFMLTSRGTAEDIVRGLEAGAEDYLAKPFHQREFLARVRKILRRSQAAPASEAIASGRLKLDPSSHEAWLDSKPLRLTLREYEILQVLMEREGDALTRDDILRAAWGPSISIVPKVVDIHIGHLRQKLGAEGKRLATVPQVGYKLLPAGKKWLS